MPSSHLILGRPLLLLPPVPPSIRVFSNESTLHMRWPKYWSFSFSINPSKEIPGLISFRMDWLDLLAVQGTVKSLLQHHSSKASILRCSAFFTVQLSHPCFIKYVCFPAADVTDLPGVLFLSHILAFATLWTVARVLCPWGFSCRNIEVGCHFLLPVIFLTQESNLRLLYLLPHRHTLYLLSHQGTCSR